MSANQANEPYDELPPPSAELVLMRVFVESFLETAPPKQARAFMRVATAILENEQSVSLAFPLRPSPKQPEITRARMLAVALYQQLLPTLMARVPPR